MLCVVLVAYDKCLITSNKTQIVAFLHRHIHINMGSWGEEVCVTSRCFRFAFVKNLKNLKNDKKKEAKTKTTLTHRLRQNELQIPKIKINKCKLKTVKRNENEHFVWNVAVQAANEAQKRKQMSENNINNNK